MTNRHELTVESKRVYEGRVINLRVDTVRMRNGRTTTREIIEHRGAVCVVALDTQGRVLLVRQYRKAIEDLLLELPAGGLNAGEMPEHAAHRELLEETGYKAAKMEHLATFWLAPGYSTEKMYSYLATGLSLGKPENEEDEDITVEWEPLESAPQLIREGTVRDSKSIASLFLALEHLRKRGKA